MIEKALDLELAVSPQREDAVLEGLDDFLDGGEVGLGSALRDRRVLGGDDDTIRTLANRIDDVVSLVDLEGRVNNHIAMSRLIRVLVRQLRHLVLLLLVLFGRLHLSFV